MNLTMNKLGKRTSSLSGEPNTEWAAMDDSDDSRSHPDNVDKVEALRPCCEEVNNTDDQTKRMENKVPKKDLKNMKPESGVDLARNFGVCFLIVVLLYFINRLTEAKM